MSEAAWLVTGGAGFIGSHLISRLVEEGVDVVAMDLLPLHPSLFSGEGDRVRFVHGDVSSPQDILPLVRGEAVDCLIHLAYLLTHDCDRDMSRALRVNVEGTLNILEAARLMSVRRVVFTSSISVYGPASLYGGREVDEDDPVRPETLYGACKLLSERLCHDYAARHGVDVISLRLASTYGPGRSRGFSAFASELVEGPAVGQPVSVPFADTTLNWLYVRDAVRAIIQGATVEKTEHKVFNIVGYLRPVRYVADYIRKLLPQAVIELKPGETGRQYHLSGERTLRELGYKPSYTVEEGVLEHINSLRRARGLPPTVG